MQTSVPTHISQVPVLQELQLHHAIVASFLYSNEWKSQKEEILTAHKQIFIVLLSYKALHNSKTIILLLKNVKICSFISSPKYASTLITQCGLSFSMLISISSYFCVHIFWSGLTRKFALWSFIFAIRRFLAGLWSFEGIDISLFCRELSALMVSSGNSFYWMDLWYAKDRIIMSIISMAENLTSLFTYLRCLLSSCLHFLWRLNQPSWCCWWWLWGLWNCRCELHYQRTIMRCIDISGVLLIKRYLEVKLFFSRTIFNYDEDGSAITMLMCRMMHVLSLSEVGSSCDKSRGAPSSSLGGFFLRLILTLLMFLSLLFV